MPRPADTSLSLRILTPLGVPFQILVAERLAEQPLWYGDRVSYVATFQRFRGEAPEGVNLFVESPGVVPHLAGMAGAAAIEALHLSRAPADAPTGPFQATLRGLSLTPDQLNEIVRTAHADPSLDPGAAIRAAIFDARPLDLRAGAGDDMVGGGARDDRIGTGAGNDTVTASAGDDRLALGRGRGDTLTYAGPDLSGPLVYRDGRAEIGGDRQRVTGVEIVVATARADTMIGGARADSFHGGDGDDLLKGKAGDDALYGDEARDRLSGGGGADALHGGADDDRLLGGEGDDALDGGAGADALGGGNGDDALRGAEGDDRLRGGDGDDRLDGGGGDDALDGGEGDDVFVFRASDAGRDAVTGFAPGDALFFEGAVAPTAKDAAGGVLLALGEAEAWVEGWTAADFAAPQAVEDATPGAGFLCLLA